MRRYTRPLRAEHEEALKKLHEEQAQVDAHMQHRKIDNVRLTSSLVTLQPRCAGQQRIPDIAMRQEWTSRLACILRSA